METTVKKDIDDNASAVDLILVYAQNQFLATYEYQVLFPTSCLANFTICQYKTLQLGLWNNANIQLVIITKPTDIFIPNTQWLALRPLMLQLDLATFKMLGYASQMANWVNDFQFCSRCSQPIQQNQKLFRMECAHCDYHAYPVVNPCMIVLVTREDEILLARSPHFTTNMYSTLAGFVEVGESIEQCVHREVFEEVGLSINNLRYIASQNWPYPHSLMLGFHASYEKGDIVLQAGEIEDAKWFNIKQLPQLPPKQAISRYLIDLYIAEKLSLAKPTFVS